MGAVIANYREDKATKPWTSKKKNLGQNSATLSEKDEKKLQWLRNKIQKGCDDLNAGRSERATPEMFDRIWETAKKEFKRRKK